MTVTGKPIPTIRVQRDDFDAAAEARMLTVGRHDVGALVSFIGLCRDEAGTLAALELEHYPGMAEAEMLRICELAIERFSLLGLTAVHRFGRIEAGDQIVLVIAAAPHRQAAFDGANFVMDFLKTSAPFWKKEHGQNGNSGAWVDAKDADDSARDRWIKA
ncbi:molybdenum cofactor biosynthesis protein MoaE [Rhizobium sp. WL3]|uniref:molybdenum cofactor biosynthesis protein MoaE n=1 Tax=Rhizobium sp. WL3 TaxID=2603277 RepID=UPI0011C2079E|nr:molybdenum cofactor biosynthesis protein MoaE [Rhizobium sp. WL3]QEE47307.1 molybdenum cofactor biosynthesis protein MoaE [Rhizobium sp. WL3]